jgi:hypothetical protein
MPLTTREAMEHVNRSANPSATLASVAKHCAQSAVDCQDAREAAILADIAVAIRDAYRVVRELEDRL